MINELDFTLEAENDYMNTKKKITAITKVARRSPNAFEFYNDTYCKWKYDRLLNMVYVHERYLGDITNILNKMIDRDSLTIILNYLPLEYYRGIGRNKTYGVFI